MRTQTANEMAPSLNCPSEIGVSPRNGRRPVDISYISTPKEKMSER